MPAKLDRCVNKLMSEGKTEEQAYVACNAAIKDSTFNDGAPLSLSFADRMVYDPNQKTAVSIRDGVLEYFGAEIGLEPDDKIFTVYRSPATIANAASRMPGIPITDEHVALDELVADTQGEVLESEMFDAYDATTHTTIATRNRVQISDGLRASVDSGKRELSLGYNAQLVAHHEYDFEQKDIIPHHLAVVQDGRCGSMCQFIDRKPQTTNPNKEEPDMTIHAEFLDENGAINLQQIAEIAAGLPEAIKTMPLDKVQEIMPMLMEAMQAAKTAGAEMPGGEEPKPTEDENGAGRKSDGEIDAKDMDGEEDEKDFSDSKAFKDAVAAAVGSAVKRHSEVIEKAKLFLDESYSFTDKSTEQVMRDALATQSTDKFADDELPVAFKLLKSSGDYKNFGDKDGAGKFTSLKDKEL